MENCIAIDWLQLFCLCPVEIVSRSKKYVVKLTPTKTRHFAKVYSIVDAATDEECAVLATDPHEGSILGEGRTKNKKRPGSGLPLVTNPSGYSLGMFKITNKFLYQYDLKKYVENMLEDLRIYFRSITRLDISVDFQKFSNGGDPEMFIRDFLGGKLIKKGRSVKYKTQGGTPTMSEKQERKKMTHDYLSFGLESSEVQSKIYNKSQEMRDVKVKNWIVENWQRNGWDESQGDVWRLEFSLKNRDKKRKEENKQTGEVHEYNMKTLDLLQPEVYTKIWFKMLKDKFAFYIDEGKERKDRNEQVILFDQIQTNIVTMPVSKKKETGRSQKIFAKKLMELNQDLRGDDYALGIFSKDLFQYYIQAYSLESWAKKKGYNIEKSTLPEWKQYAIDQEKRKEESQSNIFIQSIQPFLQENLYNQLPF